MSARWADLGLLEAGGNALEYGCLGPATAEAPTVVLLHEGLGSRDLWRDFPARLSTARAGGSAPIRDRAMEALTWPFCRALWTT